MNKRAIAVTLAITTCSNLFLLPQAAQAMTQIYPSKPYYFHYFSIAIPNDIDTDKGIDNANFWSNEFRSYPIVS